MNRDAGPMSGVFSGEESGTMGSYIVFWMKMSSERKTNREKDQKDEGIKVSQQASRIENTHKKRNGRKSFRHSAARAPASGMLSLRI